MYELDERDDGSAIQENLAQITGFRTVSFFPSWYWYKVKDKAVMNSKVQITDNNDVIIVVQSFNETGIMIYVVVTY